MMKRKLIVSLAVSLVIAFSGLSVAQVGIIAPTNTAETGKDVELLVRALGFDPDGLNTLQVGPKGKLLIVDPKVAKIKSITGVSFSEGGKKAADWAVADLRIAADGSSATFKASLPAGKGLLGGDVLKVTVTCLAAGSTRVGFDKVRIGTARIGGGSVILGAEGRQDILITVEGTKEIKITNKGPGSVSVAVEQAAKGDIAPGKDLTTPVKFGNRVTVRVKDKDKGAEIAWDFIGDAFAFDVVKDKNGKDLGVSSENVVGTAVVCRSFPFAKAAKAISFDQMASLVGVAEDETKLKDEFKRLGKAPKGGTLRYASFANPRTLNPILIRETSSSTVTNRWFAPLVESGPSGNEGGLAESFTLSEDFKTVTITIRDGLKWCDLDKVKKDAKGVAASCDGPPFTLDDVLFTLNDIVLNPDFQKARITRSLDFFCVGAQPKGCPKVEKIGDRTVRLTYPESFLFALDAIVSNDEACCLPKHRLSREALGAKDTADYIAKFRTAWGVGEKLKNMSVLGPFVPAGGPEDPAVALNVGARHLRNPSFFKVDELGNQLPYLDGIDYSIVPDLNVVALKYTSGETDVLVPRAQDLNAIQSRVGAVTRLFIGGATTPGFGADFWSFNQDVGGRKGATPRDKSLQAVFRNPEFRRAMSNITDRDRMAEEIAQGLAGARFVPGIDPQFGSVQNREDFQNKVVQEVKFNLDKAKARLDSLGLKPGGDGIRVIPEGWGFIVPGKNNKLDSTPAGDDVLAEDKAIGLGPFIYPGPNGKLDTKASGDDVAEVAPATTKLEFELITNAGNTIRETRSQMLSDAAKQIGVSIKVNNIDFVTLVDKILTPFGDWEAQQVGVTSDWRGFGFTDSCGDLHTAMSRISDCDAAAGKGPDTREPYQKRLDELAELLEKTFDPVEERKQAEEFLFLLGGNVPMIYFTVGVDLGATRIDRIANIQEVPLGAEGPGLFTQAIIFRIDLRPGAAAATANRVERRMTVE